MSHLPASSSSGRRRSWIAVLVALGAYASLKTIQFWITSNPNPLRVLHNAVARPQSMPASDLTRTAGVVVNSTVTYKNLWDDAPFIPPWMKRYFAWHRTERAQLKRENWKERRYLVLRCLRTDKKCGGASDRLNPVPYLLMLAAKTNRLFFITWSRPAPLEEFLVPPVGGLNWTVPDSVDFQPHLIGRKTIYGATQNETGIISSEKNAFWAHSDLFLVEARLTGARSWKAYDEGRSSPSSEASYESVYGEVWRILFEPSLPLAAQIAATKAKLGLATGKYVSAHVRAQYVRNTTGNTAAVENALRCAMALLPGAPVYFASDSVHASRYALGYGRDVLNHTVVAHIPEREPLHIDRGTSFLSHADADWNRYPASAYYDTFVDLYLLSGGSCLTYGLGGYGHWASLFSGDVKCAVRHVARNCSEAAFLRSTTTTKPILS
jgi:hypothetical protein